MKPDSPRSAILEAPGTLAVREIPIPIIPGEIEYVQMRASGICGSDVRYFQGENPWALHTLGKHVPSPPNMVLGHEVSGVAERGERGDELVPVAILAYRACGTCEACASGNENLCASMEHFGHSAGWGDMPFFPGGMADRFTIWKGFAYDLPESVGFDAATFLDGLAVALHALDRGGFASGKRVAVIGLGPIGMLCAEAARALGAGAVFGCDTASFPVELARRVGVETVVRGGPDEVARAVAGAPGAGVDVVIDTVGTEESVSRGLDCLDLAGNLVLLAVHEEPVSVRGTALSGERQLTTSSNNRYTDFPRAIELLASGAIETQALITHRFPLDRVTEGFELLLRKQREPVFKVVIEP